jgi:uncharacterized protein (DUF1330 family)
VISRNDLIHPSNEEEEMKTTYIAAVSLAAGAIFGAAGVQVLHAQAKPPVYQITLQEVTNPDALVKEFVPLARASLKQHGGTPLAGSAPISIEGAAPSVQRVIINQWPSVEKVREWNKSADYRKAREIGDKYAKFQIFVVEGVSP